MLDYLDKFSVYIVIGIVGYLSYSQMDHAAVLAMEQKPASQITRESLCPVLLDPVEHSSPVDRDPFSVYWNSYADKSILEKMAAQFDPASEKTGQLPLQGEKLLAILDDGGEAVALIGDQLYTEGAFVGQSNWRIESISGERVVFYNASDRYVLTFAGYDGDDSQPRKHQGKTAVACSTEEGQSCSR